MVNMLEPFMTILDFRHYYKIYKKKKLIKNIKNLTAKQMFIPTSCAYTQSEANK